jgi:hypothetical protein
MHQVPALVGAGVDQQQRDQDGRMKLTICSGASPKGMQEYGHRFLISFAQFASEDIRLLFYTEAPVPMPRGDCRSLWDIPGTSAFMARHQANPEACGRKPTSKWKDSDRQAGYSFRFDAVKFFKQGFIPEAAAEEAGDGFLAWFDADVVFNQAFTASQITSLLPAGSDVAYLGRPPRHSEIGFQLYRLPQALPMLLRFRKLYDTDALFEHSETHSAYAFDRAREATEIAGHNLTPNGSGHVWPGSPLASFCMHLKGKRKFKK